MIFKKHLRQFLFKYWPLFLIGVLMLALVDWVQLYIPEYLGQIVGLLEDGLLTEEEMIDVRQIVNSVLIVAAIMAVGRIIWRLSIFRASKGIEKNLRKQMFSKAEKLSVNYYHEHKTGAIMALFTNDIDEIEQYFAWGTVMLVDAFFLSVLVIYKMVDKVDIVLTIIALVPILLIVLWGALVEKFMDKKWRERQEAFDNLYDFSQENFTGIRVIKAFVKENKEIHAFAKVAKRNADVNVNFVKIAVLFDVFIEILISLILALLLGFGGWFVYATVTGTPVVFFNHTIVLTADKLVEFIAYFDSLIWPAIALGQIITMKARCKASLKRISDFLDYEEEISNCENPVVVDSIQGEIEFKNFSFKHASKLDPVLTDISLKINAGESIGVVGRIGRGKTTLVNSLLRLYNVEKGTIYIDNIDIMDFDIASLRNLIAYVPQDNFLFSDTVENNINFSNKGTKEDIEEAAKFADVHDNIVEFKEGYQTVTGERGVTLSGGQKQRISIARAYIKDSPIMILDDSVSAVDVKTEETILKNIQEKRKGKTTIVVASRVSTVNKLDRIIVLADGKLEAFDTPENLLKVSPTYQKMVYLQELEKEVEGGSR